MKSHTLEFTFIQVVKVRVVQGHATRDALVRFKGNHLCEKVHGVLIHVLHMLAHWNTLPLGELCLKVLVLECFWPVTLIRSSLHLEDFENLIYF